jgi:hypothetical protein
MDLTVNHLNYLQNILTSMIQSPLPVPWDRILLKFITTQQIYLSSELCRGCTCGFNGGNGKEIPCITTRITGIPELIDDNEDGMLVAPSDAIALADKIELVLKDKQLQERIGSRARKKVETMYDLEKNCKQMAQFFSETFR